MKAGDITKAELLYGLARVHYERIEPVAESFGDLDEEIDGRRADDVTPEKLTGFHRLEDAPLWVQHSLAGMDRVADGLLADVTTLPPPGRASRPPTSPTRSPPAPPTS